MVLGNHPPGCLRAGAANPDFSLSGALASVVNKEKEMNFTGGNTLPNIGKRINWQLVTLAGGLAVAISVVAGLGVLGVTDKDTTQTPVAAIPGASELPTGSTVSQTITRPQVIIVESQAQADALEAEMAADQMAAMMQGYEVPFQQTRFLVVSTPEGERALTQTLLEQLELREPALDIVDLRGSSSAISAPDTTAQSNVARTALYVVESSEQEASVMAAMDADRIVAVMQGQEVPFQQTQFLVVSTPEDEQALNQVLMEQLLLTEPAFEIVDLRN
jgi:hypothetical protein